MHKVQSHLHEDGSDQGWFTLETQYALIKNNKYDCKKDGGVEGVEAGSTGISLDIYLGNVKWIKIAKKSKKKLSRITKISVSKLP